MIFRRAALYERRGGRMAFVGWREWLGDQSFSLEMIEKQYLTVYDSSGHLPYIVTGYVADTLLAVRE